MMNASAAPIELWGGVECTVNRVAGCFHDQLRRSNHLARPHDIDRFADLGLRALRVPLIWELTTSSDSAPPCFAQFEPMLQRTRERGLRPIAGLVHHGSGPRFTNLLDPQFEHHLARYARQVAERHPWIEDYTPINEPLTTARFSALYGHWYPHAADNASFLRALVHESRATIRAMRAIRTVQPRARLVQTEDIATVSSTPQLCYQADYENERRFLSFDLLCGRVDRGHPLYGHLLAHGITEAELAWFVEHACVPDLLGVNYYFTSDRYLDERLDRHPAWSHGSNGRHRYADVEAVRVPEVGLGGHSRVLNTVWRRYRLPIAITEVHAGCTREEQMRWLVEAWQGAQEARADGVDVRALTAWALLGSYDWNSLVRVEAGVYEPGVFDLRGPEPRATALVPLLRSLAHTGSYDHPVLSGQGWWRKDSGVAPARARVARPLLITGGRGGLAQAFARACEVRSLAHVVLSREQLDIADREGLRSALGGLSPWAVINAAGLSPSATGDAVAGQCQRVHAEAPVMLVEECRRRGARVLTFSSDQVFDGAQQKPYLESDPVHPRSVYGASQAQAERAILQLDEGAMIVRTSSLFGPHERHDPLAQLGRRAPANFDALISPTYVPQLVDVCLDLLIDGASGIWHLSNLGAIAWSAFIELLLRGADVPPWPAREFATLGGRRGRCPVYSVLGSERGAFMPPLEAALERYRLERPMPAHRNSA